jgi:hypothetical protein
MGAEVAPAFLAVPDMARDRRPTVAAPKKMGFGHEIISSVPEHELDAEVTLEYLAGGLFWSIDMPARGAVVRSDESDPWT